MTPPDFPKAVGGVGEERRCAPPDFKTVGGVGEERRCAPPDFNKSKRNGQFMQSGVARQYVLPTATSSA
jgi:hypothetical protein